MWSKEEHYHELKLFLLLESAFKLLCDSLEMKIEGMKLYMQTVLLFSKKRAVYVGTFSNIAKTLFKMFPSICTYMYQDFCNNSLAFTRNQECLV